jgi:hypothetical protein
LRHNDHRFAGFTLGAGVAFGAVVAGSADFTLGAIAARRAGGALGTVESCRAAVAGLAGGARRTGCAWSGLSTGGASGAGWAGRTGGAGDDLHHRRRFALAGGQGEGGGQGE